MEWLQLQLAFWGERINWRRDLAALFDEHLGIKVTYSEEELSTMEAALDAKLSAKERRSSPEYQALVRQYRARRAGYAAADQAKSHTSRGGLQLQLRRMRRRPRRSGLGVWSTLLLASMMKRRLRSNAQMKCRTQISLKGMRRPRFGQKSL